MGDEALKQVLGIVFVVVGLLIMATIAISAVVFGYCMFSGLMDNY